MGELRIGPVQFARRAVIVMVWIDEKNIINHFRRHNLQYEVWGVGATNNHDLLHKPNRRSFLRALESGRIAAVIWAPFFCQRDRPAL